MSCQDVSARMLELIYGELGDDERATLETHIAGCADCRAERQGLERTRAVARQVLDEPVPARARAAILAAAAHAAAKPALAAAARTVAKPATPARADRRSFWDWVRARWTLPTLATVGAVAVFVLGSRLFLSPEKTYERGRQVLAPVPAGAPERQGPGAPAEAARSPAPAAPESAKQERAAPAPTDDRAEREISPNAAPGDKKSLHHSVRRRVAADEEVGLAAKPAVGGRLDALVGKADKSYGADGLAGLAEDADRGAPRSKGKDGDGTALRGRGLGSAMGGAATRSEGRAFAPPPPPAAVAHAKPPAADMASVAKPEKKAKKEISDEAFTAPPPPRAQPASPAAVAEGSGSAPLEEETAESSMKTIKRKAPAKRAQEPAAPPLASAPPSSEKASGGKASEQKSAPAGASAAPARAAETAVQRADRLFAEGRWIEAAAAYRELLRGDPRNGDADRWRKRLAMAQAEVDVSRRPSEKASAAPAR